MNTALLDRIGEIRKKAAEQHTGAMVAFIPAESEAVALALSVDDEDGKYEDAEPWHELHITMAFLGKADTISEADKMLLLQMVQSIADETQPFDARAFAVNVFNPNGDEPCLVVGVGGNELESPRKKLWELFDKWESLKLPDNHNPWVPHLTLTYFKDKKVDWKLAARVAKNLPEKIRIDRIRVAFGGRSVDFPLLGSHEDEIEPETATSETKPVSVYEKARKQKELGKCRYCKAKATHKIGIDGGAWIGTCDEHEEQGRSDADGEGMEEKAVRHVRTAAGSRRFGQPIGSIIVRDVNLTNLKISKTQGDYLGWTRVEDSKGKQYDVGKEDGKWYATGVEGGWDDIIAEGSSEDDVYKKLDAHVGKSSTSNKPPLNVEVSPYAKNGAMDIRDVVRQFPGTAADLNSIANDLESGRIDLAQATTGVDAVYRKHPKKSTREGRRLKGVTNTLGALRDAEKERAAKAKPKFPLTKKPAVSGEPGFKKVESEFDGYDQYEGNNGKTLWSYKEGNKHVIVDEDNEVIEEVGRNELLGALHRLLKGDDSEPKATSPATPEKPVVTFEVVKARGSGIGWQIDRHEVSEGRKKSSLVRNFTRKADAEAHIEYLKEREAEDPGSTDKDHPNYKPFGLGNDPRTNEPKRKPTTKKPVVVNKPSPGQAPPTEDPDSKRAMDIMREVVGNNVGKNGRGWAGSARVRAEEIFSNLRNGKYDSTEAARQLDIQAGQMENVAGVDLSSEIAGFREMAKRIRGGGVPKSKKATNGSVQGPGGQGHIPEDPDKVVLTKPKDLDSGMMVNIGEGGWKYIGQIVKVTKTTNKWMSREGTLAGQYRILDPWGEQIAIMSPNNTVEVDTNVPKRGDMRPKQARKPYPSREVYFEPAPGVAGQQNPFEDDYPDFDEGVSKIYGKPIRYVFREKHEAEIGPNNFATGRTLASGSTIVRRERDKNGKWNETVIRDANYTGTLEERNRALYDTYKQYREMVEAERAKAGVGNYKPWSVPAQRRVPKAKPVANTPQTAPSIQVPTTPEGRREAIVDGYRAALKARGISEGYVYLTDVRRQLPPGMSREEQDEAIRELNRMSGVRVIAEANQKTLTGEHRANAVNIGNQDKHLISIDPGFRSEEKVTVVTPGGRVGNNARHGSRSNGENWVEQSSSGELPEYIRIVRNGLMRERGMDEDKATALAVAAIERWARGGDNVSPKVQAAAVAALAQWEKMKAEKDGLAGRILSVKAGASESRRGRQGDGGGQSELRERVDRERGNVERARRSEGNPRARGTSTGRSWDEDKHPRDGGKFAPKGSSTSKKPTREGDDSVTPENSTGKTKEVPESWKKKLPLKYGDQSPGIQRVQEVLDAIPGLPKTEKDGIYGNKTTAAIKALQKMLGIKETGVLDEKTFAGLINYKPRGEK